METLKERKKEKKRRNQKRMLAKKQNQRGRKVGGGGGSGRKELEGEKGHQKDLTFARLLPLASTLPTPASPPALLVLLLAVVPPPVPPLSGSKNDRITSSAEGSFSTMARASSSAAMSSSLPKNGTRTLTPAKVEFARAAVWQLRATTNCRGYPPPPVRR